MLSKTDACNLKNNIFALSYIDNIDMEATVFNPVQQHLLMMFAHDGSEKRLLEVKRVLTRHFSNRFKMSRVVLDTNSLSFCKIGCH